MMLKYASLVAAIALLAGCSSNNQVQLGHLPVTEPAPIVKEADPAAITETSGALESVFPKVEAPYLAEQAADNGDVVNVHGRYYNLDKWDAFIENIALKQSGKVRLTKYTIEGDPIFYELVYNGDAILYTFDNGMDAFGNDLGRPSTICEGIGTKQTDRGDEVYTLRGCDQDETADTFFWAVDPDTTK
ncbi:DUF4362 domain-containing protein [Paenibacillus algorifonticola]|uniref:DUF4362 domain-containing protein n=1 Tax=Paenibacillus algorifonticola TaxID=684063 RepID=UPI003D2A45F7